MRNNSNEKAGDFKSKFEGYGAVPSKKVWKGVSDAINEKRKKRILFWWFFGLIGFGLLAFQGIQLMHAASNEQKLMKAKAIASKNSVSEQFTVSPTDSLMNAAKVNESTEIVGEKNTREKVSSQFTSAAKEVNSINSTNKKETFLLSSSDINNSPRGIIIPNIANEGVPVNEEIHELERMNLDKRPFLLPSVLSGDLVVISRILGPTNELSNWRFNLLAGTNLRLAQNKTKLYYDMNETAYESQQTYKQNFLGLSAGYQFSSKIGLELGFKYIHNKYVQEIGTFSRVTQSDRILALPLGVDYQFKSIGKWTFSAFGGMQFQYMWSNQEQVVGNYDLATSVDSSIGMSNAYTLDSYGNEEGFYKSRINTMTQLGFHVQYALNPNWSIRFSPYYQYYTKKCQRFSYITSNSRHWIGFQVGIQYQRMRK
jgi:hypothetical protein